MEATAAVSCCRSDEAVSAAGGVTMLGVVCARGAVCGANQPSCGDEFASIALAASPYDCQTKVAPIPMENMIRKRARPREALPPSDDGPIAPTDESIGSRPGRARSGWSAATSGWCAAFRKRPPTLASSPSTSVGFWPMRSRKCATVKSCGNLGGVGVTAESIDSSTVFWLALTAMILWLEEGPIKAAPRPSRPAARRHGRTVFGRRRRSIKPRSVARNARAARFRSRRKLLPGIHPKIASECLGHSKIGITLDLYSHVLPGMQAEAAAAVDGALQAAQQRRTQMLANRLQSPSVLVYENKKP